MNDNTPIEQESTTPNPAEKQTEPKKRNSFWTVVIIILVLAGGVFIWKTIEIGSLRNAHKKDKQAWDEQSVRLQEEHLKLTAKPFVWAVRSEMMEGDLNQVNMYLNEMVKEQNFQNILVVNDQGAVIATTDKKDEGKAYNTIGKATHITANSIIVDRINDSVLVVSSPVMGLDKRLGTLIMQYAVQKR